MLVEGFWWRVEGDGWREDSDGPLKIGMSIFYSAGLS